MEGEGGEGQVGRAWWEVAWGYLLEVFQCQAKGCLLGSLGLRKLFTMKVCEFISVLDFTRPACLPTSPSFH